MNKVRDYQKKVPFKSRAEESAKILERKKNHVPIICEIKSRSIPPLENSKFIVDASMTIGQFQTVLKKKINCNSKSTIIISVNNKVYPGTTNISEIYNNSKDADGFLYIDIDSEMVFG